MARRRNWEEWYPPSRPREAKGGIKSQKRNFGESWWARRWIKVLEGFDIGARLGQGRTYARKGQVLSITITEGAVRAKVQGSRPKPYDIVVQVRTISDADWQKVAKTLTRQAVFAAKLLAGEMPNDIERIFEEAGLSLFPTKLGDLSTKCSCPDWSNPCKHIAAVYYLLGEEFDRDPFLIFALRGMSREALMARLGEPGGLRARRLDDSQIRTPSRETVPPEPLTTEPEAFWGTHFRDEPFDPVTILPESAALPRRLGHFPFWRGEQPLLAALTPIYTAASPNALDVFLGQNQSSAESRPGVSSSTEGRDQRLTT